MTTLMILMKWRRLLSKAPEVGKSFYYLLSAQTILKRTDGNNFLDEEYNFFQAKKLYPDAF